MKNMGYIVFVRNWWKPNRDWPNGLEPNPRARKTIIAKVMTESEARAVAQRYNATHTPGRLSRKAEYTNMKYW